MKLMIVLLLMVLVPARAIASVTMSVCAPGQEQAAADHRHAGSGGQAEHGGGHADHHEEQAPADAGHGCGFCSAHCAGVAFAVPTIQIPFAPHAKADRISFASQLAPGFLPDLPDRPPLVS